MTETDEALFPPLPSPPSMLFVVCFSKSMSQSREDDIYQRGREAWEGIFFPISYVEPGGLALSANYRIDIRFSPEL